MSKTNSVLQIVNEIAQKHLNISTLETQNSDRLDFHDVPVWQVEMALLEAFSRGVKSADQLKNKSKSTEV